MTLIKMNDFIEKVNTSELSKIIIPMKLVSGWPFIAIKGKSNSLCVGLPYFSTAKAEKGRYLYAIKAVATYTFPSMNLVSFSLLPFSKEWEKVDFSQPVGLFKHDAIKDFTLSQYNEEKANLYDCYDRLIISIIKNERFAEYEEMKQSFQLLMEPSLYPFYKNIAPKFYEKYCGLQLK